MCYAHLCLMSWSVCSAVFAPKSKCWTHLKLCTFSLEADWMIFLCIQFVAVINYYDLNVILTITKVTSLDRCYCYITGVHTCHYLLNVLHSNLVYIYIHFYLNPTWGLHIRIVSFCLHYCLLFHPRSCTSLTWPVQGLDHVRPWHGQLKGLDQPLKIEPSLGLSYRSEQWDP